MNRRISYRLNKMDKFARTNRESELAVPIIQKRWLYLHGNRTEKSESEIYHLYEQVKKVL